MKPEQAISRIKAHMEIHKLKESQAVYTTEALNMAICALKEIQQYREIGASPEQLKELIFEGSVTKRILRHYQEIGTVEECRKAVEKQIQKKCAIDSCPDHTHYKCPSCGQIELSIYKHGFPRLGRITKYCENCGQSLQQEDI